MFQLLDNVENKMKGTCVEGTIPKLFRGKMVVCSLYFSLSFFVERGDVCRLFVEGRDLQTMKWLNLSNSAQDVAWKKLS